MNLGAVFDGFALQGDDELHDVHDTNRWDKNPTDGINRHDLANARRRHDPSEFDAMRSSAPPQEPKRAALAPQALPDSAARDGDEHAGLQQPDAVVSRVLRKHPAAGQRELRL